MEFRDNDNPLKKVADQREEKYFSRIEAEKLARAEEAIKALRAKLGVRAEQTLRDFLHLSPSKGVTVTGGLELDPEIGATVGDFFASFERVYLDAANWEDAFRKKNEK